MNRESPRRRSQRLPLSPRNDKDGPGSTSSGAALVRLTGGTIGVPSRVIAPESSLTARLSHSTGSCIAQERAFSHRMSYGCPTHPRWPSRPENQPEHFQPIDHRHAAGATQILDNFEIVISKLGNPEHVIEGGAVDGEECDGLVGREGAEGLCGDEPLPLR